MTHEELQNQLSQAEADVQFGNYGEAERLLQQMLLSLSNSGKEEQAWTESRILKAGATRLLGVVRCRRGDYLQALEILQSALQTSLEVNDQAGVAKTLGHIGIVYWFLCDYPNALEYHTKAMSIAEELGDTFEVATHLGDIGLVHWHLFDYTKALECYGKALRLVEGLGSKSGVARHLGNIGNVYRDMSDYPKALENYSKALSLDEELGNKPGIAKALGSIGNVYGFLSDFPKALEYYSRALSLSEELGNRSGVAIWLGNIGILYMHLADYPKALDYLWKAVSLDEELGNTSGVARHLGSIGNIHVNLADNAKALEYLGKALNLHEVLGNRSGVAATLGNIGIVYNECSDYSKALECYRKALSLDEEVGNRSGVASHLGNIGILHMDLSDYTIAQEYLERSLCLREELGMKSEVGGIKASLGQLYASDANTNRDESKAEALLLESIEIGEELGTKKFAAHKVLADLYVKQKRWEDAYRHQGMYFRLKEEVLSEEAKKKAHLMEQQKQLAEREKEIAISKAAADAQMSATTALLYKVLPESVATRMINGEPEIADYFTNVSILFADIAGFTPISADMPAIIVVRFLNYVFAEFDRIIKKHGCEKIKTIGDGYMAIAGAPIECADHAERLTAAAIEMQETISLPESIREYMPSDVKLGVRIGLHTGSVVAGVIGEERFVYDIYSDAVNTAARMESHGEENKIHVSNDFFRHLQNRFAMTKNTTHGLVFEKRGEMEIKGKGIMRTYFLENS